MKPKSSSLFASSLHSSTTSRLRTPFILAGSVAALFVGQYEAAGASFSWNNGTGLWSDLTQWNGGTVPPSNDNTTLLTFGGSGVTGYTSTVDTGGGASDPWGVNGLTLNSTASAAETIDDSNTNGIRFMGTIPFLTQLGSGAFNISAPLSLGSGISVLTLGGNGAGLVTVSSPVSEESAGLGLTKTGSSSFTLTNTNSYTGATTLQRGTTTLTGANGSITTSSGITLRGRSTLALNNTSAANNGDRIAGGFASAAGGGTLNFLSDSAIATNYSESIGAVTTGTGTLNINTSLADTGQTSILTLDSLARTAGGTLRLSGNGLGVDDRNRISVTTAPTLTAGILPYVILVDPASSGTGMVNFATHDGGAGGALTKYISYETGAQTTWTANTVNARPAGDQSVTAARTLNSLMLDDTIDLLASGGDRIITTGQGGLGAVVQTGGTSTMLISGTSEVVLAFGTSEAIFNIDGTLIHERDGTTVMTGTGGLTKTGPGALTLRGAGASTRYNINVTGQLNLNQGLFDISLDGTGLNGFTAINLNGGDFTLRNTSGSGTRIYSPGFVVNADGTLSFGVVAAGSLTTTFTFSSLAINNGATLTTGAGPNANVGSTPKLTIAGTTTLNSDATLNTGTGATVTLVGAVGQDASARSLAKDGPGTLVLSAAGSYTGGTTIKSGILNFVTDGMGTSGNVTFTGGTLLYGASNSQDLSNRLHNSTGAVSIDTGANVVTYASAIDSNNTGGLTKLGSGTLTLAGNNAYTGLTTISAGTLSAGAANNLGEAASNLVFDGGTLQVTGIALTNFSGIGHTVSFNSGKTVGLDINNSGNTFTVDQVLNQTTGGFTKLGAGTVVLNQNNTYTGGTTLTAGVLNLGSAQSGSGGPLGGSGTVASVGIISFGGGTLQFSASNQTDYSSRFSAASGQAYKIDTNGQSVDWGTGRAPSGTGTLTKLGAGTLNVTTVTNGWTGATTIDAGTLNVGGLAAVNTNSSIGKGSSGGSAADLVFGGGTLQYTVATASTPTTTDRLFTIGDASGLTATIDSSSATASNTLSFTGTGALEFGVSGARTLTLTGINTGANTFTPIIGDGTGGATDVIKSLAGTWVLAGANTYTGTTQVNAGTLLVNGSTVAASAVSVTAGTLGGTGTVAGTVGMATGTTLAPGSTSSIGTLATGSVTLVSGTVFDADINTDPTATSDRLNVTGDLNLAGATLAVENLGTAVPPSFTVFTIATYSGTLSGIFNGLAEGATVVIGSLNYTLKYADGGKNITLTAPEKIGSPYGDWAAANITNIDPLADPTPAGDPDKDGTTNLAEFAFNGDPLDGSDNGQVYMLTVDSDYVGDPSSANELVLTVAVRTGTTAFAGTPSPTANQAADGITYTIEGSTTLGGFNTLVNVVPTPVTTNLPAVGAGYEYRSFSLDGSNGLPGKGFLRAKAAN
ncbi:MAG: autotransporter-associated beta strand repeat-containing protein [Verrucomicrobiota bacterium]